MIASRMPGISSGDIGVTSVRHRIRKDTGVRTPAKHRLETRPPSIQPQAAFPVLRTSPPEVALNLSVT